MKKIMFGILFLAVIMISSCSPEMSPESKSLQLNVPSGGGATRICEVNDGGRNYYLQGDVYYHSAPEKRFTDTCVSDNGDGTPVESSRLLKEYYCDDFSEIMHINYGCVNGCLDGVCLDEPSYMDPTQCVFQIATEGYGDQDVVVGCDQDQFVGKITHILCPVSDDNHYLISTGWMTNTLPFEMGYTCVDSNTGEWKKPTRISAYCCNILDYDLAGKEIHKTSIDKSGNLISS